VEHNCLLLSSFLFGLLLEPENGGEILFQYVDEPDYMALLHGEWNSPVLYTSPIWWPWNCYELHMLYISFSWALSHVFLVSVSHDYFPCSAITFIRVGLFQLEFFESTLWSSGQSFWLQIQMSRARFRALPDFLSSRGSGTVSAQPCEDKWVVTWTASSGCGLESRD
jgi:hypothetical protein